jgi:hypothetical protein
MPDQVHVQREQFFKLSNLSAYPTPIEKVLEPVIETLKMKVFCNKVVRPTTWGNKKGVTDEFTEICWEYLSQEKNHPGKVRSVVD